jgi:hypothetical protein
VVVSMANGETAEVGMIGREGIVGAIHLLGSSPVPTNCFIQLVATALRIPMPALSSYLSIIGGDSATRSGVRAAAV